MDIDDTYLTLKYGEARLEEDWLKTLPSELLETIYQNILEKFPPSNKVFNHDRYEYVIPIIRTHGKPFIISSLKQVNDSEKLQIIKDAIREYEKSIYKA